MTEFNNNNKYIPKAPETYEVRYVENQTQLRERKVVEKEQDQSKQTKQLTERDFPVSCPEEGSTSENSQEAAKIKITVEYDDDNGGSCGIDCVIL